MKSFRKLVHSTSIPPIIKLLNYQIDGLKLTLTESGDKLSIIKYRHPANGILYSIQHHVYREGENNTNYWELSEKKDLELDKSKEYFRKILYSLSNENFRLKCVHIKAVTINPREVHKLTHRKI